MIKDLLSYLYYIQNSIKESFVIYLIIEVKINYPKEEVEIQEEKSTKGKGKKAYTILVSNTILESKYIKVYIFSLYINTN